MERISSVLSRTFSFLAQGSNNKRGSDLGLKTHKCHLSTHPAYPPRATVTHISWAEEDLNYKPVEFTHKVVLDNDCTKAIKGWADPQVITAEFEKVIAHRTSNALVPGGTVTMVNGKPRNPIGRTGLTGRGLLGKYGPNYAADPLVTRFDPDSGKLQMAAIQRSDNKQWAIPGGMVDPGETVSVTLKREFYEEARNLATEDQNEVTEKLNQLFESGGTTVFVGYVDDPRNTDISWMETICVHFHITDSELAKNMKLKGGSDAAKARWLDISDSENDFRNLYASHRDMVIRALKRDPVTFASALMLVAI